MAVFPQDSTFTGGLCLAYRIGREPRRLEEFSLARQDLQQQRILGVADLDPTEVGPRNQQWKAAGCLLRDTAWQRWQLQQLAQLRDIPDGVGHGRLPMGVNRRGQVAGSKTTATSSA
jgi:hypothetical protein